MMRITFLGTGDAFCSEARGNMAILLELDDERRILLDCGPVAQQGLRRLGLKVNQLDWILISHLHGDHAGGLPFMALSLLFKEPGRVRVSGPEGLEGFIKDSYSLFYRTGDPLQVLEVVREPSDGAFSITRREAQHSLPAFMYRIEYRGRSLAYTGDTARLDLRGFADGVDCLIHEAAELEEGRARQYGHTTPWQAAEVAKEVGAQLLVLVHHPPLGQRVLEEVKSIFPHTLVPDDGQALTL